MEDANRKAELEAKKKAIEEELQAIEAEQEAIRDKEEFHRLVAILDNGEFLASLIEHTQRDCSDDNAFNGFPMDDRRGRFFCDKCALLKAVTEWKNHRDWLLNTQSASKIHETLDIHIGTIGIEMSSQPI